MPASEEPAEESGPARPGRFRAVWASLHLRERGEPLHLRERGERTLRIRAWRLRLFGLLALQAGIAATITWYVSYHFLDNPTPVLAPTTAVGIVAAAMGSRVRRTLELLVGITLGLAAGDLLMPFFGIGPWQTGLVVVLAIIVAVALKGGGSLLTQAGGTAVLIATLEPPVRDLSIPRFVDAAVGGLIGIAVGLLVVPIHPQRTLQRLAAPLVGLAVAALDDLATAVRTRDPVKVDGSLNGMRNLGPQLTALNEGLGAAEEVVRWAPLRWRERSSLAFHAQAVRHLERSLHSCRSMARRLAKAIKDDEPIPDEFSSAIEMLANSVWALRSAMCAHQEPRGTREQLRMAVELVGRAQGGSARDPTRPHSHRLGYSGMIAAGELRTAAQDLLTASGMDPHEAVSVVRRAGEEADSHD
ncbi:aromatic acid exporter family protein [Micromonospora orduensis]|uniref:FUSC family protein n=1 Tax=Micromonospora orduensis TaxID=1420891 RepID=UPI00382A077D